jgi:hypothetical protein
MTALARSHTNFATPPVSKFVSEFIIYDVENQPSPTLLPKKKKKKKKKTSTEAVLRRQLENKSTVFL